MAHSELARGVDKVGARSSLANTALALASTTVQALFTPWRIPRIAARHRRTRRQYFTVSLGLLVLPSVLLGMHLSDFFEFFVPSATMAEPQGQALAHMVEGIVEYRFDLAKSLLAICAWLTGGFLAGAIGHALLAGLFELLIARRSTIEVTLIWQIVAILFLQLIVAVLPGVLWAKTYARYVLDGELPGFLHLATALLLSGWVSCSVGCAAYVWYKHTGSSKPLVAVIRAAAFVISFWLVAWLATGIAFGIAWLPAM
ncbi:MAG: hypothetical protein MJE77_24200 [Proteobacteria bacterium]|nr:hypothetical protein [Pseudomonadota bacterium]